MAEPSETPVETPAAPAEPASPDVGTAVPEAVADVEAEAKAEAVADVADASPTPAEPPADVPADDGDTAEPATAATQVADEKEEEEAKAETKEEETTAAEPQVSEAQAPASAPASPPAGVGGSTREEAIAAAAAAAMHREQQFDADAEMKARRQLRLARRAEELAVRQQQLTEEHSAKWASFAAELDTQGMHFAKLTSQCVRSVLHGTKHDDTIKKSVKMLSTKASMLTQTEGTIAACEKTVRCSHTTPPPPPHASTPNRSNTDVRPPDHPSAVCRHPPLQGHSHLLRCAHRC